MAPTRYLESLDTVRFARPSERRQAQMLSEIEITFSVLVGHPLVASDAMSFDSLGFLDAATKLIAASKATVRAGFSDEFHPLVVPIRFAWRDDSLSYAEMVARFLEATVDQARGHPVPKRPFILSGWPEINSDSWLRCELAACVRDGRWGHAESFLRSRFKNTPLEQHYVDQIDALRQVAEYAALMGRRAIYRAEAPSIPLLGYCRALMDVELEGQYINTEFGPICRSLRETVTELDRRNVPFSDRTQVRLEGPKYLAPDALAAFLEYLDTAYNRVVSEGARVDIPVFSATASQAGLPLSSVTAQLLVEAVRARLTHRLPSGAAAIETRIGSFDQHATHFFFPLNRVLEQLPNNDPWQR